MVPLTLEVQHRVNDVFEDSRAGDRAFFVHMPDEEDRNLAALGQKHQLSRALADLADASGRRGDAAHEHGLNGIDHRHHRPRGLQLPNDGLEVILCEHHQAVPFDP